MRLLQRVKYSVNYAEINAGILWFQRPSCVSIKLPLSYFANAYFVHEQTN